MRHANLAALALSALALAAAPAPAADESATALVRELLAAKTPEERKALVDRIVAAKPDPAEVAKALAEGRAYAPDLPKGWVQRVVEAPDGKVRPYLLYVPENYVPGKRHRLVVDLHGGVARPQHLSHDELEGMKQFWAAQAAAGEWFLALPAGDKDAMWWDATGSGMVLRIVAETKRAFDVDDDAVFVTGFSDGGSGALYLAAAHPTPFAGFFPLNGHVGVAGAAGFQVHLRNLLNKPVYAVNTDLDQLYPAAGLKPVFDAIAGLGAPVTWRVVEGFGHDASYLPRERPAILAWMDGVRREPWPKSVVWEGADGAPSRVHWLAVGKVTGGSGKEPFPDVNPLHTETRVRLGVMLDQAFAGPGARITGVNDGSLAAQMGLAQGDVITGIDGADVANMQALRGALSKKAFGQEIRVRVRRGAETIEKTVQIPPVKPEPAFERKKPWGSIRATVSGNRVEATCLGIASFDLYLAPQIVDLAKPVEVVVNGGTAFAGKVAPDVRFMVERGVEDRDRSLVCWARLPVSVPAAK